MLLWITPSLAVGNDWPEEDLLTADEATTYIQTTSGAAWCAVSDEPTAAEVLHNLGLSDAEIADRFHWAHTGQVLQP